MKPLYFEKSLGLDIRETSVSMCLLGKKLRGIDIIGCSHFETEPLTPQSDAEAGRRFLNRINEFLNDYGARPEVVSLSLPRHYFTIKTFNLPAPDRQTIDSMIEFELERHFASAVEDLNISYHVESAGENTFRITAAGINKETAEFFLNLLDQAGIKPNALDVSTFSNLNLLGKIPEETQALMDIGPAHAELTILQGSRIEISRSVPIADPEFSAIFYDAELSLDEFREKAPSTAKYLAESLQSTLYSCTNLADDVSIDRIQLFGGGEFAEPLAQILEEDTGVMSRTVLPPEFLKKSAPGDFEPTLHNTALGLALRGVRRQNFELNLLPPERIPFRKQTSLRTTLALCFITALLLGTFFVSKVSYNQVTLDSLNDQLKEVKLQVGSLEKVDQEFQSLAGFANRLNRIDRLHPLKVEVLQELGAVLPKDTYITRFSITKNKMEIQGYSQAASRLIGEIENSPMFRNAAFSGSIVNEKNGQKFTIRAELGEKTS